VKLILNKINNLYTFNKVTPIEFDVCLGNIWAGGLGEETASF